MVHFVTSYQLGEVWDESLQRFLAYDLALDLTFTIIIRMTYRFHEDSRPDIVQLFIYSQRDTVKQCLPFSVEPSQSESTI